MELPRISVITPSFNQGRFLEKTIRSLLEQDYPNLEHIVIDGGSTDGSVDILKRHQAHLAHWVSEPDRGQGDAINKGFRRATGDILCWLNSDDYYESGSLRFVGEYFDGHPDVDMICGHVRVVNPDGQETELLKGHYGGRRHLMEFWHGYWMHQPGIFWRRGVYETIGGVNERLHLTMDYDYWIRIAKRFHIVGVDRILASATAHPAQKTSDGFLSYKRAQLRDVIRYHGIPWPPKDILLSVALYEHLLRAVVRICQGRGTIYHPAKPLR